MSDTMNLYQALLSAQKAFDPVVKNNVNPAFKSRYADLGSVIDAITPALHAHGLVLVQRFTMDGGGPILATDLIHAASGERLTSAVAIACKDPLDPQRMGSAITYYRRYSLLALLGIAPEDDDSNAASRPAERPFPTEAGARTAAARSSASTTSAVAKPSAPAEGKPAAVAHQGAYPATPLVQWDDDQLWSFACDEARLLAKRKAALKHYLGRLANEHDILYACENMKALHPEDVAELRDQAVAALKQPAGVAG
jgi:ERF superfamily